MAIFYSKTTGGFYDDAISGTRTIMVADPSWTRPTITVSDPLDSTSTVNQPDPSATAPMIEVLNTLCTIPDDATPVTEQQHVELLAAQQSGQVISPDSNGNPTALPPAAPTTDQVVDQLVRAVQSMIDAQARAMGYDDIRAAVTYAEEPSVAAYQVEGKKLRAWRSNVWQAAYTTLDQVRSGALPAPAAEALLAQLPQY